MHLTPTSDAADFCASDKFLENKRKIVFAIGRDLNIQEVTSVDLSGSWWRIWDSHGKLYLVNPDKVNYAVIA